MKLAFSSEQFIFELFAIFDLPTRIPLFVELIAKGCQTDDQYLDFMLLDLFDQGVLRNRDIHFANF